MQNRSLFSLFLLMVVATVLSIAQPQPGMRGNREEMMLKRMKEQLNITDDQAVKIKAILTKVREEMQKQMENGSMQDDREAWREAMMKRTEKSDAEIMKVLTKEQQKKYQEMQKARQKEMEERRRERQ